MKKSSNPDVSLKLDTLAKEAQQQFTLARKGSEASLLNYKVVGNILVEVKTLCPRGSLKWAKDNLDIGKQWVANLVFLSSNWSDYEKARSWAEANGEILGRKEFGVDGAVALIKRYRKTLVSADQDTGAAQKRPSKVNRLEAEVESLRSQLNEVLAENARLMNIHVRVKETLERRAAARTHRGPLPNDIKERARKVSEHWHRNSNPNERATAEQKLKLFAQSQDMDFEMFLKACGIERPVDWTPAKAA